MGLEGSGQLGNGIHCLLIFKMGKKRTGFYTALVIQKSRFPKDEEKTVRLIEKKCHKEQT